MNSFVDKLCCKFDEESSGDELYDADAVGLSHVGEAVHAVLGRQSNRYHHKMWNVTSGKVVGSVHQTPINVWGKSEDPKENNDDWFPEKMAEIIGRAHRWADVMSLGPPDGRFLTQFKDALTKLAERAKTAKEPIIVRLLFGNIVGMPVNCGAVIKELTKDLPQDTNMRVWVGAWRKGFSWNHAKLIAVDGVFLHTGGHNLWDKHYLSNNPVHDLSIELEGAVARDGHRFANVQWEFIESNQKTCIGFCVDKMPDGMPTVLETRVTVSEWPEGVADIFPPMFSKVTVDMAKTANHARQISGEGAPTPIITIGRLGSMVFRKRSSDDAIIAMINSSQKIIRFVLQDLGPVTIPGTKTALPGLKWPKAYLSVIGKAIYERGVDIEMVLSNPNSVPGGLKGTEANYGNGWSCVDVAAEIIKSIKKEHSECDDSKLRAMVSDNLRICFLRNGKKSSFQDGNTRALHSKHFIVDDVATYIGSQNLYMCDLAEWGVVIDSEAEVKKIKEDYFDAMWRDSYTGEDVDVQAVMDGLKIDRDGEYRLFETVQQHAPHHGASQYLGLHERKELEMAVSAPRADGKGDDTKGNDVEIDIETGDAPALAPLSLTESSSPEKISKEKSGNNLDSLPEKTPEKQDPTCSALCGSGALCGIGDSLNLTKCIA